MEKLSIERIIMKEKLLKIINNYGIMPQLKYLQSEIFELNEAIIRFEEAYLGDNSNIYCENLKKHIIEELADVEVMLLQLKEYYNINDKDILEIMNQKIDRQLKRIMSEEEKNKLIVRNQFLDGNNKTLVRKLKEKDKSIIQLNNLYQKEKAKINKIYEIINIKIGKERKNEEIIDLIKRIIEE